MRRLQRESETDVPERPIGKEAEMHRAALRARTHRRTAAMASRLVPVKAMAVMLVNLHPFLFGLIMKSIINSIIKSTVKSIIKSIINPMINLMFCHIVAN